MGQGRLDGMPRVLAVLLAIALIVYALIEVAWAEPHRIRLMPRWLWVFVIVCLPVAGAILWLLAGRPINPGGSGGGRGRPMAPDDDPDFLRRL